MDEKNRAVQAETTALTYAAAGPGHRWYNETRTFNVRCQLTRMTATGSADTGYDSVADVRRSRSRP